MKRDIKLVSLVDGHGEQKELFWLNSKSENVDFCLAADSKYARGKSSSERILLWTEQNA